MALLVFQFLHDDSNASMAFLLLQLLHGDIGGLQYFPWSFWFLHGAYMLLFFHDASCVSVASWFFLFLHLLYLVLQVAQPCFWCSISFFSVLLVFYLLRSATRAPVAPWNF